VDCWAKLGIRPFEHLDVAGTPVFMLWIGTSLRPLYSEEANEQVWPSTCSVPQPLFNHQ
jgi:hypothetical protein